MRFDAPSPGLIGWFGVAVVGMLAHKVECWIAREWLASPFFGWVVDLAARRGATPEDALGAAIFVAFVSWLLAGLAMGLLILRGGSGPLIALGIWGLTFVLEWHHVARALAAGGYYPGLATAVVYLAIGPFYWREWARHVHPDVRAKVPIDR